MNVKQLKEALKNLADELPISSVGCDCVGDANGVVLEDGVVYITRKKTTVGDNETTQIIYRDQENE